MLTRGKSTSHTEPEMPDTYQIYRRLKRARASDAISREIATIFGQMAEERLATRQDIREINLSIAILDKDLKAEIATSRAETLRWILAMMIAQTGLLFAAIKALT